MAKSNGATAKSIQTIPAERMPRHVAVIMDGNGRWARSRFLPRVEGHRSGAKTVRMVVEESRKLGIRHLTLFAFSTENWQRPADEVSALMKLFRAYLESELELLLKQNIRLRAIGDLSKLPSFVREILEVTMEKTRRADAMDLVLAVSYGGRQEIVNAAQKLAAAAAQGTLEPAAIDEVAFARNLYEPEIPDPDLLIRTSDECRISNFLLWQLAYAEIVVSPLLWPEFSRAEFHRCLEEYSRRERRFGLTDEQVREGAGLGAALVD